VSLVAAVPSGLMAAVSLAPVSCVSLVGAVSQCPCVPGVSRVPSGVVNYPGVTSGGVGLEDKTGVGSNF
jgi:hypothetical protein